MLHITAQKVYPRALKIIILFIISISCLPKAEAYKILSGELRDSEIYPGTVHTFKISVPDGYSGNPARLYLGLDGILCNAPAVIDTLIAESAVPEMIGLYLQPGVVFGSDGQVLRYNRSNEFDATDGMFVDFLERELLPEALKVLMAEYPYAGFMSGGENAMIFGLSSGGIAAFNAAWHRPDLFGRVFAGCGTFVPMRGGNDIAAIVRKSEPKPLRICLEDGYDDVWNPLFGSWFEANKVLASALDFAGYDAWYDWGPGVHSVSRSHRLFPQVMRKMWKNWQTDSPKAGITGNKWLAKLLEGGSGWELVWDTLPDFANAEPGKAVYPDSTLLAEYAPGSNYLLQSYKSGSDWTGKQRFYWLHTDDNSQLPRGGMAFDGEGMLWVITPMGLQICDQNGRVRAILKLPGNFKADGSLIVFNGEEVYVKGIDSKVYKRRLNFIMPEIGERPKTQGAG